MIYVREICEDEFRELIPLIKKIFPHALLDFDDDDLFYVASMGGDIVGFMHLVETEDYFVLKGLGVDQSHRSQGAGTALMEKLSQISDSTSKKIYLKVKSLNPAVRLYENYGFIVKKFGTVYTLEKKIHN